MTLNLVRWKKCALGFVALEIIAYYRSVSSHRPFVDLLKDTYLVYLGKVRLVMRTKPDSLFVALSSQEPDTIDDKAIHADTAE